MLSSLFLSTYLAPFYSLQHPTTSPLNPDSFHDSTYYNVGKLDVCIVVSCIALMAILRDALRLMVFEPFARWKLSRDLRRKYRFAQKPPNIVGNGNGHANGITPKPTRKEMRKLNHSVLRFAEQGWSFVYYSVQWAFGLYVHLRLPTRILDPTDLWLDYPHIPLAGPVKFYYLSQTAFYIHQVLIINAEAPRKDYTQMLAHHIITVILMTASYMTNFTRVGCVIMVLMDYCDIFLPFAKMMLYLGISQLLCDLTFVWFMLSWFVTRHALFLMVIYSTIFVAPTIIDFEPRLDGSPYISLTAFVAFCIMLLVLQVLQCIWFWMICRTAYRVVTGSGAADERSDDEAELSAQSFSDECHSSDVKTASPLKRSTRQA